MLKKLDIGASEIEQVEAFNALVDAVNTIQTEREAEKFEIQEWISIIGAVRESVNVHEKQIDELQMKVEPEKCEAPDDPYIEQRKWIGKLCKFRDNYEDKWHFGVLEEIYQHSDFPFGDSENFEWAICEPVKPDDSIIYKGE